MTGLNDPKRENIRKLRELLTDALRDDPNGAQYAVEISSDMCLLASDWWRRLRSSDPTVGDTREADELREEVGRWMAYTVRAMQDLGEWLDDDLAAATHFAEAAGPCQGYAQGYT